MSLNWSDIDPIPGWLSHAEGEALYRYAKATLPAPIVEIGSYCGRSTACLARAAQELSFKDRDCILSIDTHKGSIEHKFGGEYFNSETVNGGVVDTLPVFLKTLQKRGLTAYVTIIIGDSVLAATGTCKGVTPGMIFVDGSHEEADVRRDAEAWMPKLMQAGIAIFHDYGTWPGVTKVVDELLDSGHFEYDSHAKSLIALRKVPDAIG